MVNYNTNYNNHHKVLVLSNSIIAPLQCVARSTIG